MQNFNMLPFVGIYLFYIFSMVHTSDLDQNNYVLETKSGIVDPDDVISTAVVKRKFQCAFMCSRLEECLVYTVRLQAGSNAYTCQFVKDRVWTLNSFSGVTVYRHRHRDTADSELQELTTDVSCICHNGGTCTETNGSKHCQCTSLHSGNQCQYTVTDTDDSQSEVTTDFSCVCQNGGTCVDTTDGSKQCQCTSLYSGNQCQFPVTDTSTTRIKTTEFSCTCQNGGTCTETDGSKQCQCTSLYSGNQCQFTVTECGEPPNSNIFASTNTYTVKIKNQSSGNALLYRMMSSYSHSSSSGYSIPPDGYWYTFYPEAGHRLYVTKQAATRYLPLRDSDGTWYCWFDVPYKNVWLTVMESIN